MFSVQAERCSYSEFGLSEEINVQSLTKHWITKRAYGNAFLILHAKKCVPFFHIKTQSMLHNISDLAVAVMSKRCDFMFQVTTAQSMDRVRCGGRNSTRTSSSTRAGTWSSWCTRRPSTSPTWRCSTRRRGTSIRSTAGWWFACVRRLSSRLSGTN